MRKTLYLRCFIYSTLFLLLLSRQSYGQNCQGSMQVSIVDSTTLAPLDAANIAVINITDSLIVRHILSNGSKVTRLDRLACGKYILLIAQVGYQSKKIAFAITDNVDLPVFTVKMTTSETMLQEVKILGEKPAFTVKKDTVQFDATAIKTQANDNVEALLKKIPIIDIDRDGNVLVEGKQVSKILIEGKEFFGEDIKAATKNLPADAINSVQVIDEKTDEEKRTGVDNGERNKVINLKLKADKKNNWFGNATLEAGNQQRYLGQLNLNHFNEKTHFSIISLSNNENETGFSLTDLNTFSNNNLNQIFASNSITQTSGGRVNVNGMFSGVAGGLITTHSGGINFSTSFGAHEELKLNANLIAVLSSNTLVQKLNNQVPVNGGYYTSVSNSTGTNSNNTYRFNMSVDYAPDSLTTVQFKPSIIINNKQTKYGSDFLTLNQDNTLISNGNQDFLQGIKVAGFAGQLGVSHRFKPGYVLSYNGTGNYTNDPGHYSNRYANSTSSGTDSTLNQMATEASSLRYMNNNIAYSFPLNNKKDFSMTISQELDHATNPYNQITLNYNPVTGIYNSVVPLSSGTITDQQSTYSASVGVSKATDLSTFSLNVLEENLILNGKFQNTMQDEHIGLNKWRLLPNATFTYRKAGTFINVSVQLSAQLPSVAQLLPILNNTNPLVVQLGNPNLMSATTAAASFIYSNFSMAKKTLLSVYYNANLITNGFSTASNINTQTGVETNLPINTDGNFSSQLGVNFSTPTKVKSLKIRFGFVGSVNGSTNYINNSENKVLNASLGINGTAYYDLPSTQLSLYSYESWNNASNSFQSTANQHYFSIINDATISHSFTHNWRVFSDVDYLIYTGSQAYFNTSFTLINGGFEKLFFTDNRLSASLNVHDLLNENANISHTVTLTGQIQTLQTNTIGRYFYIKLVYKFNKK